jgi:agmatinase
MTQSSAFHYLAHGGTPFFRLPTATPGEPKGARAVLLGVPTDAGTTYQPGARLAPYHVRRVSALVNGFHPLHRLDPFERLRAVDGGNVVFPPFDAAAMRASVCASVGSVLAAGATPFLCGGDHSITLPTLRAMRDAFGPVAVVHVDAHADTSGPETWGEAYHHGTPLRHALSEGLIAEGGLMQIGLRAPYPNAEAGDFAARRGALVVPAEAVSERGAREIGAILRDRVRDLPCYVTIDVDGIDPAFAPGTGTPVPGGLTPREVFTLLRALAGVRLVGMDVVEICPALDHADLTSHLGAHLLYEGLALAALRVEAGG